MFPITQVLRRPDLEGGARLAANAHGARARPGGLYHAPSPGSTAARPRGARENEALARLATALRAELFRGFAFDEAIASMQQQNEAYRTQYPRRVEPRTSNQILRGDGLLVEADQMLYAPDVTSADPRRDFDDYPEQDYHYIRTI